ncbi:tRNA (N6-threonylcarbamoyladenosine(37)-N6)-methyltransferase TrmO [Candidatus Bipolaricaulota bacterium]|nr:tRNA (N6-threonylcarbamoyladenosine(37)-N6)-methyltransferase TrmO [Candidatus Bipolaricaulota bacterium]
MELVEIGEVKSKFDEPLGPEEMRGSESVIEVYPEYEAGLTGIEDSKYIHVLFGFHLSDDYELVAPRRHGEKRGVFASRSPNRPGSIGSTVIELKERNGNELRVKGLDAVNETPVIDIKPYAEPFDSSGITEKERKQEPRKRIRELIERGDIETLLLEAGEVHGHFCPFLALGVLAGQYAVSKLESAVPGMEETVAIVETNSCFSDGIQHVTGCTFGNNGLIYRDYGKTATTVATREGSGIRLYLNREDLLEEDYPEGRELFEKVVKERNGTEEEEEKLKKVWRDIGFDLVTRSAEELFKIEKIDYPDIPDYAPIYEDEYCESCGEKFMAPKGVEKKGKILCRDCATEGYFQLDGSGLRKVTG